MVEVNKVDEAPKSNSGPEEDVAHLVNAQSSLLNNMEEEEEEDEDEEEYEDDELEEEDEDEDEYEEEDDEPEEEEEEEEEKVNDGEKAMVVFNNEGLETDKENKGKTIGQEQANKDKAVKKNEKKAEEPKNSEKLDEKTNSKGKRPRNRIKKKDAEDASATVAANGDKPESSNKKKPPKRVESMGMVFMCSSKTKTDCFRYKILGLPENKKDQVAKIYKGMRLFLFDVDLRLMYGIFKAAAPGGYNIEPKAFKSEYPSQVRFTVLDDCLPLAEEKFKDVIKENYYTRNKFEGLLKSEQVKKLCKLFLEMGRGGPRSKATIKPRRARPVETRRKRAVEARRSRADDMHTSQTREKRKRRAREEERRPRSPPGREKRQYTDYDRRPAVVYEREPPLPRYRQPPLPPIVSSPRLYSTYERPLEILPYHVSEPPKYRVLERDLDRDHDRVRDRDPYYVYSREAPPPPPSYREPVYTFPPEYHIVSREYHHPPAAEPPEYRLSGGSRVASYRDVDVASDYRSVAPLPEYRSRTHYRY